MESLQIVDGSTLLIIDPDGDVVIRLANANGQRYLRPAREQLARPSAEKSEAKSAPVQHDPQAQSESQPQSGDLADQSSSAASVVNAETEYRFRVSSRSLGSASPVWKAVIADARRHREQQPRHHGESLDVIRADGWPLDAMSILLGIIHGRTSHVPTTVTLDTLTNVAVLVHHYKCHESVRAVVPSWIDGLASDDVRSGGRALLPGVTEEAVKKLFIAWVFCIPELFMQMAAQVVYILEGPIETMAFPFPGALVYAIDNARQKVIEDILDHLFAQHNVLADPYRACPTNLSRSARCSALLLGQLVLFMRNIVGVDTLNSATGRHNHHQHQAGRPFYGLSAAKIYHHVRHGLGALESSCELPVHSTPVRTDLAGSSSPPFGSPWDMISLGSAGLPPAKCCLREMIQPFVDRAFAGIPAIQLEDFPTSKPHASTAAKTGRVRLRDARRNYTAAYLRGSWEPEELPRRRKRVSIAKSKARFRT